jgi:ankyrin repeat protein
LTDATNSGEENALFIAAINGFLAIVRYLLSLNVLNVEAKNNVGATAMMAAAGIGKSLYS